MATHTERETRFYNVDDVIEVVQMLSNSQGFYGRLLEKIEFIRHYEPEEFEKLVKIVEEQKFTEPLDVVLFFEQ